MRQVLLISLLVFGFVCPDGTMLKAAPKNTGLFIELNEKLQKRKASVEAAEERERLEKEKAMLNKPSQPPKENKVFNTAPPSNPSAPSRKNAGSGKGAKIVERKKASALVEELNTVVDHFWTSLQELIKNPNSIEGTLDRPLSEEEKDHLDTVLKKIRKAWMLDTPGIRENHLLIQLR